MTEHPDPLRDLGAFIREQRSGARLSLRRLSELAGISNPYLSQIERGLRRPSAEILQQIARGLRISAETLYVQAGILDERARSGDLAQAIMDEPSLGEEQKQTLLHIYRSFQQANEDHSPTVATPDVARPRRSTVVSRSRTPSLRRRNGAEQGGAVGTGLGGTGLRGTGLGGAALGDTGLSAPALGDAGLGETGLGGTELPAPR